MITIRIIKKGMSVEQLQQDINLKFNSIKLGMKKLGMDTQSHMRNTIKTNKKRKGSSGNLEKQIKVHIERKGKTVGIGRIAELNTYAPYWYFLNYGISQKGMKIPGRGKAVPGYFGNRQAPNSAYKGTGVGTEKFHYAKGYFVMKATSPITPINYIEKAKNWLKIQIRGKFDKWTKKTMIGRK